MYQDVKSFLSQQIDQFTAFLTGKVNEAALVAVSKSYDKTMTNIDIKLGQVISAGEKRTYVVFISNADSFGDFI